MMHPVSGYIIFRDAPLIELAVQSILPYVDDLYLLDRSEKETAFPSHNHPKVRVAHRPQAGDYFGTDWKETDWRNKCINAKCQHDWVLAIDADEVLDDLPHDTFRNCEETLKFQTLNLYDLNHYVVKNNSAANYNWWPDWHVRFWDRRVFNYNESELHCNLVNKAGENAVPLSKDIGLAIWHLHVYARPERRAFFLNRPEVLELADITGPKPKLLSRL